MVSSSNECVTSSDCLDDSGVVRICYPEASFSNETFFCDCSNWYGWSGENCDEIGPGLLYLRFSLLVLPLWGLAVVIFTGRTLYYHLWAKKSKGTSFDPVFYTGFFIFLGAGFLSVSALMQLPAAFDPKWFQLEEFKGFSEDYEILTVRWGLATFFMQFGFSFALFLVPVLIVYSWLKVISRIALFFPNLFIISEPALKKIVKGYLVVVCSILMVFLILQMFLFWALVVSFSSILVTLMYVTGYNRFTSTLTSVENRSEVTSSVIKTVTFSAKVNTICLCSITILSIVFFALSGDYEATAKIGQFNYVMFIRDLGLFASLAALSFNSWYVYKVTVNILKLQNAKACCFNLMEAKRSSTLRMSTPSKLETDLETSRQ